MAVIDKISVKNTSYDIGADSDNVVYDSNNSVKDKIDGYEAIIPFSASSSNKLATANDIPSLTNYIEKSQTTGLVKNDGTIDTTTYISDISGKADKVTSATSGNFAGLDNNGNLTDSGNKASDFAAASHNQPSNTINAMTGYEKASTASAISTSDTLNQAIGKLEKGLESADIPIATTSVAGKVKPDGTTITIDANGTISSSGGDLSNYIQKSATEGLVKNDGTIDTSKHVSLQPTDKNLTGKLEAKTWNGLTNFNGDNVWTDGDNIYYSYSSDTQKVLDKSTSTWNIKSWSGISGSLFGNDIWTDGDNIYYSYSSDTQYILDKSTSTWSAKTWNGYSDISGVNIWTDGDNIYYSSSNDQYILDKSTSTWSAKTWTGLTSFYGASVWTDGENIYYSNDRQGQYVLNKSTSTWSTKTWNNRPSNFFGTNIWTDGENIYFSNGDGSQYVLDKSTSRWNTKSWTGYTNIGGDKIWTDGDNIYYSNSSNHYVFATEGVYGDGFVKSDGSIVSSPIAKTRYTITATNWSNSVDANGYYTYTITLSSPTLSTSYPPNVYLTGANDSTFYTDTEAEQYSYVAQCNLTASTTLVLYAKTKPDTTFYVFVEGQVS